MTDTIEFRSDTTLAARFDKKVVPVPEAGCWLWLGGKSGGGYGLIFASGRLHHAHRVAWAMRHGALPREKHVCHKCDTPACVNPDHLFIGTHAENMADRGKKGRAASFKGESHPNAKLSEADIPVIRNDTRMHREIAADYGVKEAAIFKIKHRLSWRHIP